MKADPATSDPELDRDLRALFAGVAQPVAPASLSRVVEELPEPRRAGLGAGLRRRSEELIGRPVRVVLAAGTIVLAIAAAALVLNLRGGQSASYGPAAGSATASPVGATTSSGVTTASSSPMAISKEAAVAAAEKFIGRPLGAVDVSDPKTWPGGQYIEIMEHNAGADVWVDAATGKVVFMMLSAPLTTAVNLTPEQAQSAAAAFLTAHNVPFDGLTATVALLDHHSSKEYTVTWQRYANGASVPDMREVGVDPATGQVFSFMDRRVAYAPVPSPALSRDQAIARAIVASGLSAPTVVDVQLLVDSSTIWPGRLVWSVQLSQQVPIEPGSSLAYVSACWVYVDAVTGETKIAGQG
jgi:hypothetical protein